MTIVLSFVARLRLLLVGLTSVLAGCGGYASTTRIVNGETLVGRPIEPESYALYFNAQLSELQGGLHRARQLYLEATRLDPSSPELWTRVGALSCRLKLALADREMERAVSLDPWYAPAWVARARCELFRKNFGPALRFAKAAQVADPEALETTLVLVDVYRVRGQLDKAFNQLRAFVLRYPDSSAAVHQLGQLQSDAAAGPTATGDSVGGEAADEVEEPASPAPKRQATPDDVLVHALLASDLSGAQARATTLRLAQSEVARMALELNRPALANQHMAILVAAKPYDSELRALALLAAARAQDDVTFQHLLVLPDTLTPCSPQCRSYVDQVLSESTR